MRTTEEFQVGTREEAEKMVKDFQAAPFPKVSSYEINEEGNDVINSKDLPDFDMLCAGFRLFPEDRADLQ